MILYRLRCDKGHEFETWFRSSADYESQHDKRLLSCPHCGSGRIEKALMAPSISQRRAPAPAAKSDAGDAGRQAPAPAARRTLHPVPPEMKKLLEVARQVRRQVTENADYVGPRFAEEARKIHYKESKPRGIYGETSPNEAEALREEGVEILPLPSLPEDQN